MPTNLIDLDTKVQEVLESSVRNTVMHFLLTGKSQHSDLPLLTLTEDVIVKGSLPLQQLVSSVFVQCCLRTENPFGEWQNIGRWKRGEYSSSSAIHGQEFMYLYTIFDIIRKINLSDLRRLLIAKHQETPSDQRDKIVSYEEASKKVSDLVLKVSVLERHYQIQQSELQSELKDPSLDDIIPISLAYLEVQKTSNRLFHKQVGWVALNFLLKEGSYIASTHPILRLISVAPILKFLESRMEASEASETAIPETRSLALQVFLLNAILTTWFPELFHKHLDTITGHFTSIFASTGSVSESFFKAYMFFGEGKYEPTPKLSAFLDIFYILNSSPEGKRIILEVSKQPLLQSSHGNIDEGVVIKILKRVTGNEIPVVRISKKFNGEDNTIKSKEEITKVLNEMASSESTLGYVIVHNQSSQHWGLFIILKHGGEFKLGFFDPIGKEASAYSKIGPSIFSTVVECLGELKYKDTVKEGLIVICEANIQQGNYCGWAVIWAGEMVKQQVERGIFTLTIEESSLDYPSFITRVSRFYDTTFLPESLFEVEVVAEALLVTPAEPLTPRETVDKSLAMVTPKIMRAVKEIVFFEAKRGSFKAQSLIPKGSFISFKVPQNTNVVYLPTGKIYFLTDSGSKLPSIHLIPAETKVELSGMEILKLADVEGKSSKSSILETFHHILFQCQEQDTNVKYLLAKGGMTIFSTGSTEAVPDIYLVPEDFLAQFSE